MILLKRKKEISVMNIMDQKEGGMGAVDFSALLRNGKPYLSQQSVENGVRRTNGSDPCFDPDLIPKWRHSVEDLINPLAGDLK